MRIFDCSRIKLAIRTPYAPGVIVVSAFSEVHILSVRTIGLSKSIMLAKWQLACELSTCCVF